MNRQLGALWLVSYAGCIVSANWLIEHVGIVPVGFGLAAPAGVYMAGLAFTFRDLVHEHYGAFGALGAVVAGAAFSWWISPEFAVASGTAFLVSELADLFVYTPLRERRWLAAVFASNVVGLIVDSALFLYVAFQSFDFLAGQVVGKAWVTLGAVALLWLWRRSRRGAVPYPIPQPGESVYRV